MRTPLSRSEQLLTWPLVAALAAGCARDVPARGPATAGPAEAKSCPAEANDGVAELPAPPAPPPPLPAFPSLRARGQMHGAPVFVPASGERPSRWLVFLGTDDEARGAWLVDEHGDGAPVDEWPPGLRVLGGIVRGRFAYLWIETLEAIGQAPGIRAPLVVSIDGAWAPRRELALREAALLAGAVTLDELRAGVALLPRDAGGDPREIREIVTRASASPEALRAAISRRGLVIARQLPTDIVASLAQIERDDVPSSPYAGRLSTVVRDAVRSPVPPSASWDVGREIGGGAYVASGHLLFVREGVSWTIRGMIEKDGANPWDERPRRWPTNLSLEGDTSATEQTLRERVGGRVVAVLGQARFLQEDYGPDNSIGAAVVEEHGCQRVVMAFSLHGRSWIDARLAEWNDAGAHGPEACARSTDVARRVRFADFDGDGLADVLLWARRSSTDTRARVFFSPRAPVGWGSWAMRADKTTPSVQTMDVDAAFLNAWQALSARAK